MGKRKTKAKVFETIEDLRVASHLTREELGRKVGISKERVDELINDGTLAKQFYQVMKILEELRCPLLPASYFKSDDIRSKE